ncbi:hypothetical protein BKA65DRAFT_564036 [Rhexocercosporidium sp. MPI-PUGE-AT-0058]|nr:hypothetical protein BKA65DRAFT_564036 [Rhexocercosporidium sp. MPI-PUGE-AT-0058]
MPEVPLLTWSVNITSIFMSATLLWLIILGPFPPSVDYTFLPDQQTKAVFHLDNQSYIAFDKRADDLWKSILPSNDGRVLATNISSGFHYWATVAMFHQLSCLRNIRYAFLAMSHSADAAVVIQQEMGKGSAYEKLGVCFDYIRQGLLCAADTTLHPVARLDDGFQVLDGNALWHTCNDHEMLYKWAEMSGKPRKDPLIHESPSQ